MPTVIAGDFNASSRNEHHLRNVESLAARGLVSAYHSHRRIEHAGAWADATSYHHRQASSRHHMDYVFVPADWSIRDVEVGSFDEYMGRRLSDHVPIVVSVHPGT
jgi:endonuclease/exonuclease/phosphatase family metal-dependent hydrolase